MGEPATESERQYRQTYGQVEDEARPPYDRSAILPNLDGDDAWLFEPQDCST
jgi:hypothetical protein